MSGDEFPPSCRIGGEFDAIPDSWRLWMLVRCGLVPLMEAVSLSPPIL
jgi:hypothetical protein